MGVELECKHKIAGEKKWTEWMPAPYQAHNFVHIQQLLYTSTSKYITITYDDGDQRRFRVKPS